MRWHGLVDGHDVCESQYIYVRMDLDGVFNAWLFR
jgi:hypothetical protein